MVERFFKNRQYIGIKYKQRTRGDWEESLNIQKFTGRPYNRFEYDDICEFTPFEWGRLVSQIVMDAQVKNREVVCTDDYCYSFVGFVHATK